jgi:hypothetical protein
MLIAAEMLSKSAMKPISHHHGTGNGSRDLA